MTERSVPRALFVTRPDGLAGLGKEHARLYFGHEYCAERLPSPKGLEGIRTKARERGVAFTLVTPRIDQPDLARVRALLESFVPGEGDEVVVNDPGLLEAAREMAWPGALAAGRLLTKQRRGAAWKGTLPPGEEVSRYLRGSSLDSPGWVEWFRDGYGVRRFEIDNLIQGVEVGELPADVRLSVYHPWLLLTLSRHCPWSFDGRRWRTVEGCGSPCREEQLHLRHDGGGRPIVLGGMAQFLVNEGEGIYAGRSVDRHVIQPRVPC